MGDRREEIAIKLGLCNCHEIYTSRGLTAPDCPYHAFAVTEAMDEYMKECCLELLSYMAKRDFECGTDKNGNCVFRWYDGYDYYSLTKEQLFENFL